MPAHEHKTDRKSLLPLKIETERLVLRPPMRTDVPDLVSQADNPRIARLVSLPSPYTRADAVGFVKITAQRDTERTWCVTLRHGGTFIGVSSVMFADGFPPEIGYWFGEAYWGRGFASEAVTGMIAAAWAHGAFPVIGAQVLAHNYGSARVLEKCGFSFSHDGLAAGGPHKGKTMKHYRLERRP
jgi:RimJ/RimL family protein N-acetyltransferase